MFQTPPRRQDINEARLPWWRSWKEVNELTTAVLKCYSEPVSFYTQVKNRCYEQKTHHTPHTRTHLFLFLPTLCV